MTKPHRLSKPHDTAFSELAPCPLPPKWKRITDGLHHAFQPVVNIHSGQAYGIEALLRGFEDFGFCCIADLLDDAAKEQVLDAVEYTLKRKAIHAYAKWPFCHERKLFLNTDSRVIRADSTQSFQLIRKALDDYHLNEACLILDISEQASYDGALHNFTKYKKQHNTGIRYSIDDFGTGPKSLHVLQEDPPDFIKIDHTMIAGVTEDSRKKAFFSHVVSIAHLFGVFVIAEGIESKGEYYACKEVGCDLIQGYIVGEPMDDVCLCLREYEHIAQLSRQDRRQTQSDERILLERMETVEALSIDTPMLEVFEQFRTQKSRTFFPAIDSSGEPKGIIREVNFKDYTYSQFGRDLMSNRNYGYSLSNFITPCPIAALSMPAERILEIYSSSNHAEGLIIVDDAFKYVGFLSANALLRVINDKNLTLARDQNPLSRLPGNTIIHEFLSECLGDPSAEHVIIYFDFDNFKPFNDHYGFRQGDRAIKAFADILRRNFAKDSDFIAHIGGDDFVAGTKATIDYQAFETTIKQTIRDFSDEVAAYYDQEAQQRGYILMKDRFGTERQFQLLTVSAAVVRIIPQSKQRDEDHLGTLTAGLKKISKSDADHLAVGMLP